MIQQSKQINLKKKKKELDNDFIITMSEKNIIDTLKEENEFWEYFENIGVERRMTSINVNDFENDDNQDGKRGEAVPKFEDQLEKLKTIRDRFINDIEQVRKAYEIELKHSKRNLKQQAKDMLIGYIDKLNEK